MSEENKLEYAVIKYLQKYPDFFTKHPNLLTELEVANSKGELTDLTTHQLRSLQKENRKLKDQISQLINNAQHSESLMNRLLNLLTALSMDSEQGFIPGFVNYVKDNFNSDYFKLLVPEGLGDYAEINEVELLQAHHRNHFSTFQLKSEPLLGRLKPEKIQSIFPAAADIKSAVVLPIGNQAAFGLLAFASKDEEKFHPNLSSDFLQKLTAILATFFEKKQGRTEDQAMP